MGPNTYIVYILANQKNGTLYIGVTGNPVGRVWQHREGRFEGFTKRHGVTRLVWYAAFDDVTAAITGHVIGRARLGRCTISAGCNPWCLRSTS